MLIAYDSTINVYSIATSLLVRKLRVADSDRISSFALSTYMTNHLFVSTSLGSIERWDWVEGTRLELWNTATPIHRLVTADCDNNEEKNGLIYTIDKMSESLWMFTAHRLLGSTTDLGTLLKYRESLTSARAIENGRIIVLTSGSRVIIGTCESTNAEPLRDLTYSWRDVTCRQWITSVDVRIRSQESHTKVPPNQKSSSNGVIDIAVGMVNGEIVIYDNLLENLILKEDDKNSGQTTNVSSRRLHWHRNEVLALKWSADGTDLNSLKGVWTNSLPRQLSHLWWLGDCFGTLAA